MSSGITVRVPSYPGTGDEYEAARDAVRSGIDLDRWVYWGDREVREVADACPAAGVDHDRFLRILGYGTDGDPPAERSLEGDAGRIDPDDAEWLADACRTLAAVREDRGETYPDKLRELAAVCELGIQVGVRLRIDR